LRLRRRAHRVALDIDRLLVGGGKHRRQPLRQRQRLARRHNGEQEIRLHELRIGDRAHAGLARALLAGRAAAGKRSEHGNAVFGQAAADAGAHVARRDDGDG
jgi:hypothetical protein